MMSPAKTTVEMDFGDAMRDVVRGCKITRREWGTGDVVYLHSGVLHIRITKTDPVKGLVAGVHRFIVSEGDLTASDWIVVPD